MKKFKYVGPHDGVEIPGVGVVEQGHQIEVDAVTAEGLEGQADFEHIPDPKRSKAAKKAAETRQSSDDVSED